MIRQNYDSLYDSIDIKLGDKNIKSQFQLKTVMGKLGFLTSDKADKNEKILAEAWNYLKEGATFEKEVKSTVEVTVKRRGKRVKKRWIRARTEITYKGKTYQKGQYVPGTIPKNPYTFISNRGQVVKQASYGVKVNGKQYRKGQFLPSGFKL